MQPEQFITRSMRDARVARVLHAALESVDPASLVARRLQGLELPTHRRCFLLGLGKAAEPMTRAAAETLGEFEAALVITKHRLGEVGPRFRILEAGHPVPDETSLQAGQAALRFVSRLEQDDLLICLLSGGGSALATAPLPGISLTDMQALTKAALESGAGIEEVNVVRRQLDQLKGGGLADATRATIISLILSDVVGDRVEAIASGPTAPNSEGHRGALRIIETYHVAVTQSILRALRGPDSSTDASRMGRVSNLIIGNCVLAASAALAQARAEGFNAEILDSQLRGEARELGEAFASKLAASRREQQQSFCLVAAGESTVTLAQHGKGGRNQELALAGVDILDGIRDCMLISLATDGNDGPTDAAGAVVTGSSRLRAEGLGMRASDHLARHDAYPFFDALGDLLKPGYTATNVNDLILLVGV